MIAHGAAWWRARSRRERALLATLGLLLAGTLAFLLGMRPLAALRPVPVTAASGQGVADPAAILGAGAARFGLSIETRPEAGGTAVTIGDAPFDGVVRWIAAFEEASALRVTRARITRGAGPGRVSARLMVS